MTNPEPLIAHLEAVRLTRGMSRVEWARRSGIAVDTIRQLTSGRSGGALVTAQALAGALDLDVWAVPRESNVVPLRRSA